MTSEHPPLTPDQQFDALVMLDIVLDLFGASPKPAFTRDEIITALKALRQESDLFDPQVVEAYDATMRKIGVQ